MRKIPKPLGPWVSKFAGLMSGWGGTHDLGNRHLPSGKLLHNYGKSPFLMGNSTISMDIFPVRYVNLPEGTSCLWEMMKIRQCVRGYPEGTEGDDPFGFLLKWCAKGLCAKERHLKPNHFIYPQSCHRFWFLPYKKNWSQRFFSILNRNFIPVKAAYLWRNYSTFIINSLFTSLFLS